VKQGNTSPVDPVEGRRSRNTEPWEGKMTESPSSTNVSTKLQRIAELARKMPDAPLTTLGHHIDVEWMVEAYRRTRKDGAPGVDGQSAQEYEVNLDANLSSLLDRFKTGSYRAPPVRRVHIPKSDGAATRPIGIPTFEDKVLQRAVSMVMEAVYEQEFLDCSYGFRPGRSAHQALEALWRGLMPRGGWMLEIDIQNFFDTVDHGQLRQILDQRVRDGVIRRAVDKWLKAGVLERGQVTRSDEGTPQGGVLSPLLANIYLHEVLDKWFMRQVIPRMRGAAFLIRYADDAVLVFEEEMDARRVLDVLPKRFGKYGLTLHPEKTRLLDFRKPGPDKPGDRNFDLLGFRHYWGRSRKGQWVVQRKTASSRFTRALRSIGQWCRRNRHLSVKQQHRGLKLKMNGHYADYGITGNSLALARFRKEVEKRWHKWLCRRSNTAYIRWENFQLLLERHPLPPPIAVHSAFRGASP
jgi:group II intron reverse transcriptase/maturase